MTGTERALPGLSVHDRRKQSAIRLEIASSHDSLLEGTGFEPVWGFSCQAVVFGFLSVLCSEPFFVPSLRSGSRSAQKGVKGPKR